MNKIRMFLMMSVITLTSYAQNWEIVTPKGPNGCYTTQIIETVEVKKKTALDSQKYHYDIKVTFENPLDIRISFNYRYSDAYDASSGRISLKPKEIRTTFVSRQIPRNELLNIQPIEASKLRYENFEIYGEKIRQSKYINCLEHFHIYKKKKAKEISDKKNKEINSSKREESKSLLTDKSKEFAKNGNKLPNETIYQKKRKELDGKANKKRDLENKNLLDAQNFIDNQNKQLAKQDRINQKIASDLTNTFTQISNSWAKEKDFQTRISSLTNIKSIDATSIITEARSKAQQINVSYGQKKKDALNQSVNATQNLMKTAKNEKQVIASGVVGTLGTVISQSNLEKQRKEAQEALKRKKVNALKKIVKELADKYTPIKEKHLQAAIYAVQKDKEEYHLANYEYAKCMADQAYDIVVNNSQCKKLPISKPTKKTSYTGKDYFNAYKRKSQNTIEQIKLKSTYFLELAIEKEPNNPEWLFERYKNKDLSLKNQTIILETLIELKPNNLKFKSELKEVKRRLELTKEISVEVAKDFINSRPKYEWKKHSNLMMYYENNKHYFINSYGEVVIALDKKNILQHRKRYKENKHTYDLGYDEFNNGLLRIMTLTNNGYRFGFIDTEGKIIIKPTYIGAAAYIDNIAKVLDPNSKKWGFIDINGNIQIDFKYHNVTDFSEGLAAILDKETEKWGFIDKNGNVIIDIQYGYAGFFSEGLANVLIIEKEKRGQFYGKSVYINKKGELVLEGDFDKGSTFVNGLAIVTKYAKGSFMGGGNNKSYYINTKGERLNKHNYQTALPYGKNGYAIVKKGLKWSLVDKQGNSKTNNKFWNKPEFENGIAKVDIGNKTESVYVFIDETGTIVNNE